MDDKTVKLDDDDRASMYLVTKNRLPEARGLKGGDDSNSSIEMHGIVSDVESSYAKTTHDWIIDYTPVPSSRLILAIKDSEIHGVTSGASNSQGSSALELTGRDGMHVKLEVTFSTFSPYSNLGTTRNRCVDYYEYDFFFYMSNFILLTCA